MLAKNIGIHIVTHNPKFIGKVDIDQVWLTNETNILKQQVLASRKPKEFTDKIVQGKINKSLNKFVYMNKILILRKIKKFLLFLKKIMLKFLNLFVMN